MSGVQTSCRSRRLGTGRRINSPGSGLRQGAIGAVASRCGFGTLPCSRRRHDKGWQNPEPNRDALYDRFGRLWVVWT